MTNDERMTKSEFRNRPGAEFFVIHHSDFFRHSSFVVRIRSILLLLMSLLLCSAQRPGEQRPPPRDPAQAEEEARVLVGEMLAPAPPQTNTGVLKCKDASRQQREIPFRFEIVSA